MKTMVLTLAVLLEQFEEKAWIDMYQAAPEEFSSQFGLGMKETPDGTFFFCSKIPFVHFNCAITLGLNAPFSGKQMENFENLYRENNCSSAFAIVSPFTDPPGLPDSLKNAGFVNDGSWDRMYRNGSPLKALGPINRNLKVEEVSAANSKEWSDFICNTYGLPTQSWLLALAGREGWYHFILRENDAIVEVRTFFLKDGFVWIGIDAPVPGIMTQDFEADYVLLHAMTQKAIDLHAEHFVTDIEMPDDKQKSPAYKYFNELGFSVEYRREIFVKELK